MGLIADPVPLDAHHELGNFDCSVEVMNIWLRVRALDNQLSRATRTSVACDGQEVVGYFSLAAGSIAPDDVSGRIRRNMPTPVPAIILARLAVDVRFQGIGLGRDLLNRALDLALTTSDIVGARCVVTHPVDDTAARFYLRHGFARSPTVSNTYALLIADIRAADAP